MNPIRSATASVFLGLAVLGADAQERPSRLDIWDIDLGTSASQIPDAFINYACGTAGGPPSVQIAHFTEFAMCKPDARGLHEVYFEYDDELEYWARAMQREIETRMFRGTQVYDYPVVLSLLFDDAGTLRGWRAVTDPRQTFRERQEFWTLANFLKQRFGHTDWVCTELPHDDGESAVGSYFIKDRCEKTSDGSWRMVERHYYQKKGQTFINPSTGELQLDYFESSTRIDVIDEAAF